MRVLTSEQLPDRVELDGDDLVVHGDNLDVLPAPARRRASTLDLHRPAVQHRQTAARAARSQTPADADGDRVGFGGRRYRTELLRGARLRRRTSTTTSRFLEPRLEQAHRLLADHGTLYFHIDYREAHYCKLLLDEIFGRDCFLNEIIWAYDYGGAAEDAAGRPSTTRSSST